MSRSEWERCKPWIEAALAHDPSGRTIEQVERGIADGSSFLLAGEKSAMVCDVIETKSLHVYLAGGDMGELRSGDPQLIEMARMFECGQVIVMGRRGWERALRDLGYQMLLTKEVADG